jgi:hypothetical protein
MELASATSLPPSVGTAMIGDLIASGRWTMGHFVRGRLILEGPRSEVFLTVRVPIDREEGDRISSEYLRSRYPSPAWAERDVDEVMDVEA